MLANKDREHYNSATDHVLVGLYNKESGVGSEVNTPITNFLKK
jgi:hypothetical protein